MKEINWEKVHASGKEYTPMPEALVDLITKKAHNAKIALDIACGKGGLLMKLAKRDLSVTGVDVSKTALSKAEELFEESDFEANLIHSNFNKPNFTSPINQKFFDIIIIRASFAFVDDKDAFCKEVKKMMGADSIFVCSSAILLDGEMYNSKQHRVSIPENDIGDVLSANFDEVSVISKTELDRKKWPLRTYLCRNNET